MSTITKPVILDETGKVIADRLSTIASAIATGGKATIYGFHIADAA